MGLFWDEDSRRRLSSVNFLLRLRLYCHEIHEITPLHLTPPGWHLLNTHMHTRPGSMGVPCLAQGHLGRGKEVDCHFSSYQFTIL